MLQHFKQLGQVLGQYYRYYIYSTLLLFVSIFARALEPRILEITVDYVLVSVKEGRAGIKSSGDWIASFFYHILPPLNTESLSVALLMLGGAYLAISLIRAAFLFTSSSLKESTTEKAIKKLRDRTFSHIQSLPLAYFAGISKGELVQRSTGDIDTVKRFIGRHIIAVLRLVATFVFSFIMMCMIDWTFAIICIILSPVIVTLGFTFFNQERNVWEKHEKEADKLNTLVQENLNGIRVITAFSNQDHEIHRFKKQNIRKRIMGLKQANLHTFYWPLTDLVVNLQMVIAVICGGYFALTGRITLGELLAFYTYISMVTYPMRQLGKVLSEMGMAIVAMERIAEILDVPSEEDEGTETPAHIKGDITFENVTFRYHPEDVPALNDVSFHIPAGKQTAIIGPTGSGKTTIIKLLLRLYEPQQGKILLDGKDIRSYPKSFLRSNIGVALQKAFLFSTTIQDNITYARTICDQQEVEDAAKVAEAYEMKQHFPQGFDTMVGEKGVTLSGGQKQRIALARTVITTPPIVILDDTTSAVDTTTEEKILSQLHDVMESKTSITIAHRISTIEQADQLLVLDHGRIAQRGTPEELVNVPGYFQEIKKTEHEYS